MSFLKRLLLALATGYILIYFSEIVFWARFKPDDTIPGYLYTWLIYSAAAYALLSSIALCRVASVWALFLAGALFGWLIEGVVVQTMYDDFPLNVSFTGLAWHAAISVLVGWYAVRKALLQAGPLVTLLAAGAIGLFWGVWAIAWWVEEPAAIASTPAFALFALVSTLLLMASYWAYEQLAPAGFAPSRWELAALAVVFVVFFVFAVLAVPQALVVLPPLLLLLGLSLRRNRRRETSEPLTATLTGTIRPASLATLLAIPAVATAVYGCFRLVDRVVMPVRLPTNVPVYLLTTILGFILLAVSLITIWRKRPNVVR